MSEFPVREHPVPNARKGRGTERRCLQCRAAFIPLSPGRTRLVGLWSEQGWCCSEECFNVYFEAHDPESHEAPYYEEL